MTSIAIIIILIVAVTELCGADDWTILEPSTDTHTVYVSNSEGDDTNDGLSPATPVKTIEHGKSLLRDGYPDWLLLKRGDVWTDESLGKWTLSGRSQAEPIVVSNYSTGDRPMLRTDGGGISTVRKDGEDISNFALIGIHFYAYKHDPDSVDFDPAANGGTGINWLQSGENFLIEDVFVESYSTGIVIQNRSTSDTSRNWQIRRSIIVDSYSTDSHSQGVFMYGLDNVLLEQNIIDHNGWGQSREGGQAAGGATIYNHNIYIQNVGNANVTVTGNIITRASSHGIHFRPGGILLDNLFVRNPISIQVGYPENNQTPDGVDSVISDNVILEGNDIASGAIRGTAILLKDVRSNTTTGNIVAHVLSEPTNNYGLQIRGTIDHPSRGISLKDNTFYDWRLGGPVFLGDDEYVTIDAQLGNNYYDYSPIPNGNQDAATVDWIDSNRSVATYNGSLGGEATFEAFIAQSRQQSKTNWRIEYTAQAANSYIRAGFGEIPVISDQYEFILDGPERWRIKIEPIPH